MKLNIISTILVIMIIIPSTAFSNQIEKGFLNITDTNKEYQLTGKWKFIRNDRPDYSSPNLDDSKWELISVPGQWHMLGIKGVETVWYRLTFFLSKEFKEIPVSIRVPSIADSHELYVNGKLIGGVGKISPEGKILEKSNRPGIYHIPGNILNYDGRNNIALRISDDVGWGGVVFSDFFIGNSNIINGSFQKYMMWNTSIVLLVFFLGIYHLILYIFRRQEIVYLHYFFLAGLISFFLSGISCLPYWVIDDFWFHHFIFHSGMNVAMIFLLNFAYTFFEYPKGKTVKFFNGICVLLFAVLLLTPVSLTIFRFYGNISLTIALAVDFLGFCFLLYIIVKSIILKKLGSKTIGIGATFAMLGLASTALGYFQIMDDKRLMTEGFVIFCVSWSFAMAFRFAKVYDKTDRLNESLEQSYTQLAKHNKTFEKFVPRQFLARIATEGVENIELGMAESDFVTLLFCDIRSFTELSEKMSPQELLDFLNSYLKQMNRPIHAQLGFVDKFIGDAIMAIFDLPQMSDGDEAHNAIQAAIGMQEALNTYNLNFRDREFFPINIGIGIHSGQAIIGTVGSEDRMDSTVLGDAVNLASRLEGLTKYYGSKIIVSHQTFSKLDDTAVFSYRELDYVRVKGKSDPVRIYEILDADTSEIQELKIKTREYILEGLSHRSRRDWENASITFNAALDIYPGDKGTLRLLNCIHELKTMELPENWDGALDMQNK